MAENDTDFLGGLLDVLFRLSSLHPPQVKAGGYSEDIFCSLSDDEKEEFTCAICYQILKDVRQCVNRHKFCAPCIYVWSTGGNGVNRSRCPVCRTHGFYLRDLVLDSKIQTKLVRCRLKACGWSGKLKHLASHRHLNYGATAGSNLPTGLPSRGSSGLQCLPRIEDAESRSRGQYTSHFSGLETTRPGSQTPSSSISPNTDTIDQSNTHSLLSLASLNPAVSSDRPYAHSLVSAVGSLNPAASSLRRSRIRLANSTDSLIGTVVANAEPNTPPYEPSIPRYQPSTATNQMLNRQTQTAGTTTAASTIIPHPPSTTRPTPGLSRRPNRQNIRPSLYLSPGTTPRPDTNRLSRTTSRPDTNTLSRTTSRPDTNRLSGTTLSPDTNRLSGTSPSVAPRYVNANDNASTGVSNTGGAGNTIGSNTTGNGLINGRRANTSSNSVSNTIGTSLSNNSVNNVIGSTGPRSDVLSISHNVNPNSHMRPTIVGANSNTSPAVTHGASDTNIRPSSDNNLGSNTSSSDGDVSDSISTNLRRDENMGPGDVQALSTATSDRVRLRQRVQDNRNRLATFQQSLDGRRRQVEEFQDELERMRREQLTEVRQVWQRLGQLTQELREILDVQRSELVNLSQTDTMANDSHYNDQHENENAS